MAILRASGASYVGNYAAAKPDPAARPASRSLPSACTGAPFRSETT